MTRDKLKFAGVDYGSRMAGTTVIAYSNADRLIVEQSAKKQDADAWLKSRLKDLEITKLYFDAPLSLPAVYNGAGEDYFYREADRICGAMSPMFIGGLTARAMRLKSEMPDIEFYEAYPAELNRRIIKLDTLYQKKKPISREAIEILQDFLPLPAPENLDNWHKFDALLCWLTGFRMANARAMIIGDPDEGLIYI